MPKQFNRDIFNKFRNVLNGIGRKQNRDDHIKAVIYIALTEYINGIEADIQQEPEQITTRDGDIVENPNKLILDIANRTKNLVDKSLRLSLCKKEDGETAEVMLRRLFR